MMADCGEHKGEKAHHSEHSPENYKPYRAVFEDGVNLSAKPTHTFRVKGVMCEVCIKKIEAELKNLKGVSAMEYVWEEKRLKVWAEGVEAERILEAVSKAGYEAEVI